MKRLLTVFDIDGTLFSLSSALPLAFLTNIRTYITLKKRNVPIVLTTGRQSFNLFQRFELLLHGMPEPDVWITACGMHIYRKTGHTYQEDMTYAQRIQQDADVTRLTAIFNSFPFPFPYRYIPLQGGIHLAVRHVSSKLLEETLSFLAKRLGSRWKIALSESLMIKNNGQSFSGDIFIVPVLAGKDGSLRYVLDAYFPETTDLYAFGDALIDLPMLSMTLPAPLRYYPHLVHPTYLSQVSAALSPQICIHPGEGPEAIAAVIADAVLDQRNNPLRALTKFLSPFLDLLYPLRYTPNDITRSGLRIFVSGLRKTTSRFIVIRWMGLMMCVCGVVTDVLDGIRARRGIPNRSDDIPGALLDGYADRQKEFLQLLSRAETRQGDKKTDTLMAALSCFLPSIERAYAQTHGVILPERDSKGGSMIDRTRLLLVSLLYSIIGMDKKSTQIDLLIYQKNIDTFLSRNAYLRKKLGKKYVSADVFFSRKTRSFDHPTDAQQCLFYISIFQNAVKEVVTHGISTLHITEHMPPHARRYLSLDTKNMQKKLGFTPYSL
jgi:hydroxymethylpyrimidine pyrophosphatase-like HAD family hydrolase